MNYKKLYNAIISNALNRVQCNGYTEYHHIIPKSLGGDDTSNNLVKLTGREHFICHYLLAKMYPYESIEWYKMNHAFIIMKSNGATHKRYFNSRLYEALKINFSKVMKHLQSGNNNSQFGSFWIYNPELKENKKIYNEKDIPDGWYVGRKYIWNKLIVRCKNCDNEFEQQTKELFCSDKCRHEHRKTYTPTAIWRPILESIASEFNIEYGVIPPNKEFIKKALSKKVPKNQILWFLQCNNSGANYRTMDKI